MPFLKPIFLAAGLCVVAISGAYAQQAPCNPALERCN